MVINKLRIIKNSRGQALVEAAVSIMMILSVVMGIIEFGRMMFVYNQMTSAARVAARWAAVQQWNTSLMGPISGGAVADYINDNIGIAGISGGVVVKVSVCNPTGGSECTIITTDTPACESATEGGQPAPSSGPARAKIRIRACAPMDLIIPALFSGFLGNPRMINGVAVYQYEL